MRGIGASGDLDMIRFDTERDKYIAAHQPVESYGTCCRCRSVTVLGDGLCMKCWDIKAAYIYDGAVR